jgi:hypothetical protein
MFKPLLFSMALALAAGALAAQTAQKPKPSPPPAQQGSTVQHAPAIMQPRLARLTACLQEKNGYILTEVKIVEQGATTVEPAPVYRVEGISGARLSVLVGKRVEVQGAFRPAPAAAKTKAEEQPRFEAINVTEVSGECSALTS